MSPLPRLLLCRPQYFGVEYVINPWMAGHVGAARAAVAMEQWEALRAMLAEVADVRVIEGGEHLPDMVFAANAAIVWGDTAVMANFCVPQRRPEVELYRRWLSDAGFEVRDLPDDQPLEGEGDALFHPGGLDGAAALWAGYGVRSSLEAHRTVSEMLGVEVVSLRLVDERFYHLDTCFVPLPEGRLMYYPAAFDEPSLRTIEKRIPPERRVCVEEEDALKFACNAVRIGRTIITNHAGGKLRQQLAAWGLEVKTTPMDEFMLAGGAAKCCVLLLAQEATAAMLRPRRIASPIRDGRLEIRGHLLDTGLMNRALDVVNQAGGSFTVEHFHAGERRDQESWAGIRVSAPTEGRLEEITSQLMALGARPASEPIDARLETVEQDGVAPQEFYSTTIYPTEVRVRGRWVRATGQRMDAMLAVDEAADPPVARCVVMRDLMRGEKVVCGVAGVRVHTPLPRRREGEFAFMSASVSTERRVETAIEELAWEVRRIRARGGKIVFVAGPVVIHTGGGPHLASLIRHGYVQVLLTGNALPVHDIEMNLFGTSLGVDIKTGVGVHGGHQHHLRAINRVRAAGSIREAVEQGIITGGVMYECVKNGVEYVLAGSIRDDGPLPDTRMDLVEAQREYAKAIEGAEMIVMLSSMLHSIGVGNMTPAGVRVVCVDISPSVVTKLADRGSVESTGIVTDVGLLLNLLDRRLTGD